MTTSAAVQTRVEKPGPWFQYRTAAGYEWTHAELPISGLHPSLEGLRILHLTDFHMRRWRDPIYEALLTEIQKCAPDMILFTGDFVDSKRDFRPALPNLEAFFPRLRCRLGTFAILGNHDNDLLNPIVSSWGIRLIDHHRVCLHSGEASIELIGLPGVSRYDFDSEFVKSIGPREENAVRIVLSHFPDLIEQSTSLRPDIFLCGHTHGGQICLPNGYPISRHDTLPRRLCTGIHRAYNTWLVSNRGLGFSSKLTVRLFCPAEVIEIRLVRTIARNNDLEPDSRGTAVPAVLAT